MQTKLNELAFEEILACIDSPKCTALFVDNESSLEAAALSVYSFEQARL